MLGSQRRWIEPLEDRIAVRQLRASQWWRRGSLFLLHLRTMKTLEKLTFE